MGNTKTVEVVLVRVADGWEIRTNESGSGCGHTLRGSATNRDRLADRLEYEAACLDARGAAEVA